MNPIVRNVLAVLAGWIIGSIINMLLINVGHFLFPIEGVDPNDLEALNRVMPTLSFEYFVFPFLAHAIGTLAGAIIAALIAANRKMTFAFVVGGLFLIGGIIASFMISSPVWFMAVDLLLAYIPLAYLGGRLIANRNPQ